MSSVLRLTRGYGRFFVGCGEFAISPYTNTFMNIAEDKHGSNTQNVAAAFLACGLLTFVVPVLPIVTAFTATLAGIAMCIAAASMCFTYPFAWIDDACDDSWKNEHQPSYCL